MTTSLYDWKREQLRAESARTLADLLIALRDACDELHTMIAAPIPPGQLDPRD